MSKIKTNKIIGMGACVRLDAKLGYLITNFYRLKVIKGSCHFLMHKNICDTVDTYLNRIK